ncbi:MAG: hypothetical protein ABTD50_23585 [Polyangiaceae bacterium]|jgi:hypothetical protein
MADRWDEIERIGSRPSISEAMVLEPFAKCAAVACVFEMSARRYADNTPELQALALRDLGVVVKGICAYVESRTTDAERAHLDKCVRLRNKLVHLELSRATGQLKSFGIELDEGKVRMGNLDDGTTIRVSETSTAEGRICGWLLESSTSGAFDRGREVFRRGIFLLSWLRSRDCGEDVSF